MNRYKKKAVCEKSRATVMLNRKNLSSSLRSTASFCTVFTKVTVCEVTEDVWFMAEHSVVFILSTQAKLFLFLAHKPIIHLSTDYCALH